MSSTDENEQPDVCPDNIEKINAQAAEATAKEVAALHALAAEAASKSEGHGFAEAASDDSLAASQDEASDESVAS